MGNGEVGGAAAGPLDAAVEAGARAGLRRPGRTRVPTPEEKAAAHVARSPRHLARISAALGVSVRQELGNGAGGRVLKVSVAPVDAAVALALSEHQATGCGIPDSLPRIHLVRRAEAGEEALEAWQPQRLRPAPDMLRRCQRIDCIIRGEMPDIQVAPALAAAWSEAVFGLAAAWRQGNHRRAARVAAEWGRHGPELAQPLAGLRWIDKALGITIVGLQKPEDSGLTRAGAAGVRDMSRAFVPAPLMRRVEALEFPGLAGPWASSRGGSLPAGGRGQPPGSEGRRFASPPVSQARTAAAMTAVAFVGNDVALADDASPHRPVRGGGAHQTLRSRHVQVGCQRIEPLAQPGVVLQLDLRGRELVGDRLRQAARPPDAVPAGDHAGGVSVPKHRHPGRAGSATGPSCARARTVASGPRGQCAPRRRAAGGRAAG